MGDYMREIESFGRGAKMDNWKERIMEIEEKQDKVEHPPHYTTGTIETIEYIEDKLTPEMLQGYFAGNIIKYVSRYRYKNGVEDLKKARWYLDRMIKKLEKE